MMFFAIYVFVFLLVAIFFKEKTAKKATIAGFVASFLPFVAFWGIILVEDISHGTSDISEMLEKLMLSSAMMSPFFLLALPGVIYLLVLMILFGKKKKTPVDAPSDQVQSQ